MGAQAKFSGTWKGFQITDSTMNETNELYFLDFVIINGLLEGNMRIETSSNQVSITQIKGVKNKLSVIIKESRLQQTSNKKNKHVLSTYTLKYNTDRGYLEGYKNDSSDTDKIVLFKSEFHFNDKIKPSKYINWATSILWDYKNGLSSPEKRIEELKRFSFEPVYFDYDKHEIKPEYHGQLNEIKKIVLSHSDLRILVIGHTDSDGSNRYNKTLSKRRAESIIRFFTSRGLRRDRIVIDFKGESFPVESNATSEGKSMNRRVDFKFI
jgi:outer membrane protein OmpA-like peptidoglycan-associated protein